MAVSHVDWKNTAATALCMSVWAEVFIQGFFTHAANKTQIISVEATISGPRAPSKTIALEYL